MKKAAFDKMLADYGVEQDMVMEDSGLLCIDTPKVKVFTTNGCHTIVVAFNNNGGQSWKPKARDEVAEQLSYGIENCEAEDCDVCEEK